jgi:hypothetical protein
MPIIGHGDIASAIIDRPDRLYFCSGVSNSGETRESEYRREYQLLLKQPVSAHLVYFSSLSIYSKYGRYQQHKRAVEELIQNIFPLYAIIRIGNIDWGSNPHTLINHLRKRYAMQAELEIQDVYRYIISRDEFRAWLDLIPDDHSVEYNCYGRRLKVADIVREYVYGQAVPA